MQTSRNHVHSQATEYFAAGLISILTGLEPDTSFSLSPDNQWPERPPCGWAFLVSCTWPYNIECSLFSLLSCAQIRGSSILQPVSVFSSLGLRPVTAHGHGHTTQLAYPFGLQVHKLTFPWAVICQTLSCTYTSVQCSSEHQAFEIDGKCRHQTASAQERLQVSRGTVEKSASY